MEEIKLVFFFLNSVNKDLVLTGIETSDERTFLD